MHASALVFKAIALHQVFGDAAGAGHGRDHRKPFGNQTGGLKRRFRDADHRAAQGFASGLQPWVAKAGDDGPIRLPSARQVRLLGHAGCAPRFVKMAFDRQGAKTGLHGDNLGARGSHVAAGLRNGLGHGA